VTRRSGRQLGLSAEDEATWTRSPVRKETSSSEFPRRTARLRVATDERGRGRLDRRARQEDRLEAGPVPVEKELVLGAVEELRSLAAVAEQRVWMPLEHDGRRLEVLPAHVDAQAAILLHLRRRRRRQPVRMIAHSTAAR